MNIRRAATKHSMSTRSQARQSTERERDGEMKKRWKKKKYWQIDSRTGSTPAVPWLYPTQSSWKRFANWLRLALLLSLSISLSLCLPLSAYIFLYSSLCLPLFIYLSLSTSLCVPLSACLPHCLQRKFEIYEFAEKLRNFILRLNKKKEYELINLDLNVQVNNVPEGVVEGKREAARERERVNWGIKNIYYIINWEYTQLCINCEYKLKVSYDIVWC